MADCASLLDEELSSFVFNYLTENSGSQVSYVRIPYVQGQDYKAWDLFLHVIARSKAKYHHHSRTVTVGGTSELYISRLLKPLTCVSASRGVLGILSDWKTWPKGSFPYRIITLVAQTCCLFVDICGTKAHKTFRRLKGNFVNVSKSREFGRLRTRG